MATLWLDKPDQFMLNPQGNLSFQSSSLSDFPPNKFLIAIFEANDNHPTTAALLRGLVPWFMGQKFGLKWFFIFAQMFGIPTRIAKYTPGDENVKQELISMLERMAEANYGAFPTGVDLELIESKMSGTQFPQRTLIQDANDECDICILGQTLTSSSGHAGGNRALGEVHADTKDDILNGTAEFVASVVNTQLIPAILALNYGETSEAPTLEGKTEQSKDEIAMAQRDAVLFGWSVGQLQIPVSKDYLYQRHSVPEPAADAELYTPPGVGRDELFGPAPEPPPTIVAPGLPFGGPHVPGGPTPPPDGKTLPEEPAKKTDAHLLKMREKLIIEGLSRERIDEVLAAFTTPSMQMAATAKRGLFDRKKTGRGGAMAAVARARDIAQRKALPLATVQRMRLYFDNNPLDAKAEPDSPQGIAYALHGGNAGRAWVESVTKGT